MKKGKASSTALLIAKGMVFCSEHPDFAQLIPKDAQKLYFQILEIAIGKQAFFFKIFSRFRLAQRIVHWIESKSVPGMLLHFILRKRKIEEISEITKKDLGGLDQLVVIGAGADTLGLRLTSQENIGRFPDLQVFEIDHPATQAIKRKLISSKNFITPKAFHLIAADLGAESLEDVLDGNKDFDFGKRTLFIAEGLFMYLRREAVESSLKILNSFPKGKARFLFTFMDLDSKGRPSFASQSNAVNSWLRSKSEPFLWGMSPESMKEYIMKLGFRSGPHIEEQDLRKLYLKALSLENHISAAGEIITWADSSTPARLSIPKPPLI